MIAAFLFAVTALLQCAPIPLPEYHIVIKFVMGMAMGYVSFICPLYRE